MMPLINRIYQFIHRLKKLLRLIEKEVLMKNVIKSVLGALVLSVFVLGLPVLVIVNMFIIAKLTLFLAILLVMLVVVWPFIYYFFYYALLKNYHPKINEINTKIPYLVESSIVSFILLTIGIIVLAVIF